MGLVLDGFRAISLATFGGALLFYGFQAISLSAFEEGFWITDIPST